MSIHTANQKQGHECKKKRSIILTIWIRNELASTWSKGKMPSPLRADHIGLLFFTSRRRGPSKTTPISSQSIEHVSSRVHIHSVCIHSIMHVRAYIQMPQGFKIVFCTPRTNMWVHSNAARAHSKLSIHMYGVATGVGTFKTVYD